MPVNCDLPVVSEGVWHRAQPMLLKRFEPFCAEADIGAGVGGAESRMKAAKFTVSDEKSEAGLPLLVLLTSGVTSSGVALNTQPETAARSLGKSSFETPCSTL